jgi:hypothetical protein
MSTAMEIAAKELEELIQAAKVPKDAVDALKRKTIMEVINVKKSYGTSKSDIQQAINESPVGATLYFEPGIYEVSGLNISTPLTIEGVDATFKLDSGATTGIFTINSDDVTIKNCIFDGNKTDQSNNHALILVNGENFVFDGNTIRNSYHVCVQIELDAKFARITNNYFSDNGHIPNCNAINCKGSHSIIQGNIIRNHGNGWGIRIGRYNTDADQKVEQVVVVNNVIDAINHVAMGAELDAIHTIFANNQITNASQGIKCDESDRHVITGNVMKNLHLSTSINLLNSPDCIISNNFIIDSAGGIRAGANSTIVNNRLENIAIGETGTDGIRAIDGSIVSGNYLKNCNATGIYVSGEGVVCTENTIMTTDVDMVRAINAGNATALKISGNTLIVKDDGSASQGIRVLNTVSNYIVTENIMTGATTAVSDAGVAPKYVQNNL